MPILRLDKIISDMGFASRRDVKSLVRNGRVLVDGSVALSADAKFDTDFVQITVDGETLEYKQFRYIMMHKPDGYICATEDKREKTVIELLDERTKRQNMFSVGRLDKDTEGLLLLTNDGDYLHRIISPKSEIIKRYYAKVSGELTEEDNIQIRKGLVLKDGTQCLPAKLEIISAASESECVLSVSEGKYHQVKRMLASLGKPVIYLKRLSIGALALDEALKPGQWRELTERERELSQIPELD